MFLGVSFYKSCRPRLATWLKRDSNTFVFLLVLRYFQEHHLIEYLRWLLILAYIKKDFILAKSIFLCEKSNVLWTPYIFVEVPWRSRCFPVNFVKFLRTPFFTEHLRWLLLNHVVQKQISKQSEWPSKLISVFQESSRGFWKLNKLLRDFIASQTPAAIKVIPS